MSLRTVLEYDEECNSWAIYCPELPGLTSCGDTEEEALSNFKEAVELYFEKDEINLPESAKIMEMVI